MTPAKRALRPIEKDNFAPTQDQRLNNKTLKQALNGTDSAVAGTHNTGSQPGNRLAFLYGGHRYAQAHSRRRSTARCCPVSHPDRRPHPGRHPGLGQRDRSRDRLDDQRAGYDVCTASRPAGRPGREPSCPAPPTGPVAKLGREPGNRHGAGRVRRGPAARSAARRHRRQGLGPGSRRGRCRRERRPGRRPGAVRFGPRPKSRFGSG